MTEELTNVWPQDLFVTINGHLDTIHITCPCGWESEDMAEKAIWQYVQAAMEHTNRDERHIGRIEATDEHESHPDRLVASNRGVCWHSPTSDRWPCSP